MRRRILCMTVLASLAACDVTDSPPAPDPGAAYSISGRVTSSGKAFPGIVIALGGDSSDSAITDEDGRYSFGGLGKGTYTVAPRTAYVLSPPSSTQIVSTADVTTVDFAAVVLPLTPPGATEDALPPAITSSSSFIKMY